MKVVRHTSTQWISWLLLGVYGALLVVTSGHVHVHVHHSCHAETAAYHETAHHDLHDHSQHSFCLLCNFIKTVKSGWIPSTPSFWEEAPQEWILRDIPSRQQLCQPYKHSRAPPCL